VGPGTPRPSSGREVPREPLRNKKVFLFTKRSLRGRPAHPTGGRCAEGHPARRRAGGPPGYVSPHLPLNFHFIQQKPEKKEREERKREEEAAKPCSHVNLEVYSYSSRIIT
jgi:hypothetical protein